MRGISQGRYNGIDDRTERELTKDCKFEFIQLKREKIYFYFFLPSRDSNQRPSGPQADVLAKEPCQLPHYEEKMNVKPEQDVTLMCYISLKH